MSSLFWLLAGMTLVTALPRILPMLFLSSAALPGWLSRWLTLVAPAIFGALVVSSLLLVYKDVPGQGMVRDYTHLVAALPACLVGWYTRSYLGTVLVGMGAAALLRYFAVF